MFTITMKRQSARAPERQSARVARVLQHDRPVRRARRAFRIAQVEPRPV